MTDADRAAFEAFLASEPSLIRTPSYDATAELAWQAAIAYAATQGQEPRSRPVEIPDYFGRLVDRARAAAEKASAKFPQPNYVTLKIAEEAGEVVRGAVHYAEGRMAWDEVEGEIVQLLAMLIRFVTEGDQINGIAPPGFAASAWEPEVAPVTLIYRNYRGEVSDRTITPKRIWFGSTEWHPDPQWLLTAFDHDKGADRDFALRDFGAAVPVVDHKRENIDHKPEQSHFSAQVAAACAAFDRLSPDEQSAHRQRQRDSWAKGESELARLERENALAASTRTSPAVGYLAERIKETAENLRRCDQDRIYRGKLLQKVRDSIVDIETEDEGDRVYFDSSNSADDFHDIKRRLEDWHWDDIMREGVLPDLVENCRKANERAEVAEKELAQAVEVEREACAKVVESNLGRTNTSIAAAIRARKGGENGDTVQS